MKTICLDSRLLTEMDIPTPALRLLMSLALLCDTDMTVTAPYRSLTELSGCNTGDVNKRLVILENLGLLEVHRPGRGKHANTYKILSGVSVQYGY